MRGIVIHVWDQTTPNFNVTTYCDLIKNAGVQWVAIDATSPYSDWEIGRFNLLVTELRTRGIKVIGILDAVTFAGVTGANLTLDLWTETVRGVLSIFGGMVDAWQIWNEPNYLPYQLGYCDGTPEHYVEMLKAVYPIIKATRAIPPPVLAGSLAPIAGIGTFTRRCWELGVANYCDIWGVHIYSPTQDWILNETASIITPKPIWVTESGASSWDYELEGQAQQLAANDAYFKANEAKYRIEMVSWYCWLDYAKPGDVTNAYGNPTSLEDFFGLVTVDLNQKPSYDMYKSLASPPTPPPAQVEFPIWIIPITLLGAGGIVMYLSSKS